LKYLFYLSKSYSISIVAPLVKYLDEIKRDYAFYVSEKVRKAFPAEWGKTRIINSIEGTKKFNPGYVLVPGNFVDFRIPGIKVQVFHGLGVEKPVHFAIRHFFDVYLTSGKYVTDKFLVMQKKYKYFDVIETGWLKIDGVINYPKADLAAKFGIPLDKKIILYAPTFSSKMESASELTAVIPGIIKADEYWLLKFHELMPEEMIQPFENTDKKHVRIITREDIIPYLHLSDILISDTSSVVYEFLALDKPVITYKTIARAEKAYNITDANLLRPAIDECIAYPEYLRQRRNKAIAEVNPYLDGKTAERIVTALEKLDPQDYPKKHKPLNLFRKWQIIYHSIFRKGYLR